MDGDALTDDKGTNDKNLTDINQVLQDLLADETIQKPQILIYDIVVR